MPRSKKNTKEAFGAKKKSKARGRQGGRRPLQIPSTEDNSQAGNTVVESFSTELPTTSDAHRDAFSNLVECVSSARKQNYFKGTSDTEAILCSGYRIVSFAALEKLLGSLACPNCYQQELQLTELRKGMASHFSVVCKFCEQKLSDVKSSEENKTHRTSNMNLLAVASANNCGIGYNKLCSFITGINMPRPMHLKTFQKTRTSVQNAVKVASEEHFRNVASIVKQEYKNIGQELDGDILNISVSYDGTWHKRGYSSLHGIGAVIDLLTGLVIDVAVKSKYCHGCKLEKSDPDKYHSHQCQINYEGSSAGMEVEAAVDLFERSEEKHGLRYVTMLSDGDSKTYLKLKEKNVYGTDHPIRKEECVNHIAKRMGYALRKLKETSKQSGINLGGKGRLTNEKIEKIQNYYGKALKDNAPDVEAMRNAAFASLFHMVSTDEEPHHTFCPKGENSWCHYNRSLVDPLKKKPHRQTLPKDIGEALLPIYKRLTDPELLARCTRNKTQNNNESFHSLIWQKCTKTTFVSYRTVETAALLAAMQFNKGPDFFFDVLNNLDVPIGKHQKEAAATTLKRKLSDAKRFSSSEAKLERKNRKQKRLKLQDKDEAAEGQLYEAGAF